MVLRAWSPNLMASIILVHIVLLASFISFSMDSIVFLVRFFTVPVNSHRPVWLVGGGGASGIMAFESISETPVTMHFCRCLA